MSFFDINYNSLLVQLLPVRLRNSKMVAWLTALVSPVKWLYDVFAANRSNNLYLLSHNSQVVYLQAALNDVFDPIGRQIIIVDGPYKDPLFIYLIPETKPLWIGMASETGGSGYPVPQVLYMDMETSLMGIGFIVKIPVSIAFDIARMKALINRYKLPGRNSYQIITY